MENSYFLHFTSAPCYLSLNSMNTIGSDKKKNVSLFFFFLSPFRYNRVQHSVAWSHNCSWLNSVQFMKNKNCLSISLHCFNNLTTSFEDVVVLQKSLPLSQVGSVYNLGWSGCSNQANKNRANHVHAVTETKWSSK